MSDICNHPDNENHDHAIGAGRADPRPIRIALAATAIYMVLEFVGGWWTNSLALLADAGHMATDVAALILSLLAFRLAARPATARRTYGYMRSEVLAALVNAAFLIALTVYIFYEAFQRLSEPPEVDAVPMMLIAIGGLLINGFSAWILQRGGGHQHNLNTRGAFLHVIGDMLGSVGAIVAAIVMYTTDWYLIDPILSAGIGLLVLVSAWRLLRESVDVLMESAPPGMDSDRIGDLLLQVDDVVSVHDIHVWTVTSGFVAMSGHLVVEGNRPWNDVLAEAVESLRREFAILHVTLQPEVGERLVLDESSLDDYQPDHHDHAH